MSIKRWGVHTNIVCLVCERFDEDGGHYFLKCKCATKCWQELGLEVERLELVEMRSSRDMLERIEERSTMIVIRR